MGFGFRESRRMMKDPAVELIAVCDTDRARADKASHELGVPAVYDYEAVLSDARVAAVAIFTPPHLHGTHMIQAAQAGKHIVCTKPLERYLARAVEALAVCREVGVKVISNSPPPRAVGILQAMKSALDDGVIGTPVLGFAEMIASYGPTPADDTWYSDPELCPLAPLFRIGCYKLNTFSYLLGPASEVFAFEARRVTQRPTVDTVVAQVRYQNGALVQVQSSLCAGGRACGPFLQIGGPEGTLAFAADRSDELVLRTKKEDRVLARAGDIGDDSSGYDYDYFLSLIREDREPEISLSVALDALAVFEAAVESARTGRPAAVAPPEP